MGNFFKSHASSPAKLLDVRPGAVYRHRGAGNIVETAKVIDIGPDTMGIPHVRYEVLVERRRERHTRFAAVRTLNLQTFSQLFTEPLEA
jgi:hypothetical protein